jgi:hypothetical protein
MGQTEIAFSPIYKTTAFGRTWTMISEALPKGHPLNYVLSFAENPNRKGMRLAIK